MSAHAVDTHHHDDHGHGDDAPHSTFKGYATGFVLSVILTAVPFWLVMNKALPSPGLTATAILGLAAVQIVVHMIYFLHMDSKSQGGWNLLALIFTMVLVAIALSGSIWVMYHLNHNMMPHPMQMQDVRNLP